MVLNPFVASAIGLLCASILYGLYIAIFSFSLSILIKRRRTHPVNRLVACGTGLLLPLCTAHIILQFASFCNVLDTLVQDIGTHDVSHFITSYPYLFSAFGFGLSGITIARSTYMLATVGDFLGDLVLLYRCWVLWERNWIIVLPPFLAAVSGQVCMITGLVVGAGFGVDLSLATDFVALQIAALALPLLTHILITSLIVVRLYWISQAAIFSTTSVNTASYIRDIITVVIESGILHVMLQTALVVQWLTNDSAFYLVLICALPVYSIVPTLILLHISLSASISGNQGITAATMFGEHPQASGGRQHLVTDVSFEDYGQSQRSSEKATGITRIT